jgi:hypothetical protein
MHLLHRSKESPGAGTPATVSDRKLKVTLRRSYCASCSKQPLNEGAYGTLRTASRQDAATAVVMIRNRQQHTADADSCNPQQQTVYFASTASQAAAASAYAWDPQ